MLRYNLDFWCMTFMADGKRHILPPFFYSFDVILTLQINHKKIEKCILLLTANTNILTLLYRELKTDGKSFILPVCRLAETSSVPFPPRSKDFFFASCGSLFPFTRANAQWVIHGFKVAL